jgi:WD40 repeat protein
MESYDVFLCHNSREKPAVREIYEVLRNQRALSAFLDESNLIGGEQWERHIAAALAGSRSFAVMLGGQGWGKYQLEGELVPALARRAQEAAFRVIPVLMPGFDEKMLVERRDVEELFATTMWVDLREGFDDVRMKLLVAAIRGENAFPEGRPELTIARVRFDATRWDVTRREASLLYGGALLKEAAALVAPNGDRVPALTHEFIGRGRAQENEQVGRQLASHAGALMGDVAKTELAVALASEASRHYCTPEALEVLRSAQTRLPRTIVRLELPSALTTIAAGTEEVVFGCQGGELVVWNDTKTTVVPKAHAGPVTALLYDRQARWFVSCGEDGIIHVWAAAAHELIATLELGEPVAELHAQTGASGDWLLARGTAPEALNVGRVKLWRVDTWEEAWPGQSPSANRVALLGGEGLVLLAAGSRLGFASAEKGTVTPQDLREQIFAVGSHPSKPLFAVVTGDGQLWHGTMRSGEYQMGPLAQDISQATRVRFSAGGKWLAVQGRDAVRVFNLLKGGEPLLFPYEGLFDVEPSFSRDERLLAIMSGDTGTLTIWDLHDRSRVYTGSSSEGSPASFVDDRRFACVGEGNSVRILEPPSLDPAVWTLNPFLVTSLRFSPDERWLGWQGRQVASGAMSTGDPGLFGVCAVETGKFDVVYRFEYEFRGAGFSPDSKTVVLRDGDLVRALPLYRDSSEDEIARRPPVAVEWIAVDPVEPPETETLLAHPAVAAACSARGLVKAVASPSRRWLAISHRRHLASLWEMERGTQVCELSGCGDVGVIVFDAQETRVAFGDQKGGIAVWSTTGVAQTRVRHADSILRIAFSPRGIYLAASSVEGCLRMWIIDPEALIARLRALTKRTMSDEDWNAYFPGLPRA